MAALSNYLENKLIDHLMRAQTFAAPSALHIGLLTAGAGEGSGGTEVSGGSYARVSYAPSLANWAGTQGAGTTTASSGTGGTTSNNAAVSFPTPTANWGAVVGFGVFDASSGGNLLFYGGLTIAKTINEGDTVSFPAGSLSFQIDN